VGWAVLIAFERSIAGTLEWIEAQSVMPSSTEPSSLVVVAVRCDLRKSLRTDCLAGTARRPRLDTVLSVISSAIVLYVLALNL